MKVKESVGTKIIKHRFGIHGPLDEYKRTEIGRIATNAYMILAGYMLLSSIAAALVANSNPGKALVWLIMGNVVMVGFVINIYLLIATNRAHIVDKEIRASSRKQAIKKAFIRGIELGIYVGIYMFFVKIVLDWFLMVTNPVQNIAECKYNMESVESGLLFGILA